MGQRRVGGGRLRDQARRGVCRQPGGHVQSAMYGLGERAAGDVGSRQVRGCVCICTCVCSCSCHAMARTGTTFQRNQEVLCHPRVSQGGAAPSCGGSWERSQSHGLGHFWGQRGTASKSDSPGPSVLEAAGERGAGAKDPVTLPSASALCQLCDTGFSGSECFQASVQVLTDPPCPGLCASRFS